ncbi:MAG: membrane protein insertion efficiency factor YidD [Candidatus Omnitrophica bacterium]|nr:membrane protein insertion efficiency factor YidD [Candidatus Omnitrophota bacterium]
MQVGRKVLIAFINVYQGYIRILLPKSCRFWPTCSDYSKEAIQHYGVVRGVAKSCVRILKCHPFSRTSGYDPLIKP